VAGEPFLAGVAMTRRRICPMLTADRPKVTGVKSDFDNF
jgi:hypothetical protein